MVNRKRYAVLPLVLMERSLLVLVAARNDFREETRFLERNVFDDR